jgi:hypothetical protein
MTVPRPVAVAGAEVMRRIMLAIVGSQHRRFVEATHVPRQTQISRLADILQRNAGTEYGRLHGFEKADLRGFQRSVPISTYEDFRPYINRMMAGEHNLLTTEVPYQYLLTSGSTAEPKYVPVTKTFRGEYASRLQFYHLYRQHPDVFRPGGVLTMVSPAVEGYTASGVPYGSASGLTYVTQNALVRSIYAIPYDVYSIGNFEAKYYTILRLALEQDLRVVIMANPSTILLLARDLNRHAARLMEDIAAGTLREDLDISPSIRASVARRLRPNPARSRQLAKIFAASGDRLPIPLVWPNLRAVVCWRDASAALYLPDLIKTVDPVPVYNLGYAASEGLGTFRLAGDGANPLAINGHFFEFCEESEIESSAGRAVELRLCDELEEGKRYFILFTTSGGLYRYHIDDLVEVQGFVNRTPALRFLQKGSNTFSFTGEKLTEVQAMEAVKAAASERGVVAEFFTIVPVFDEAPFYRVYLETSSGPPPEDFAATLDQVLCRLNVEFEAKRGSCRLGPTRLYELPAGFFVRYSRALHSANRAAQIKFKHLNPGDAFLRYVEEFGVPPLAARSFS